MNTFLSLAKSKKTFKNPREPGILQKEIAEKLPQMLIEAGFKYNDSDAPVKLFIGSYSKHDLELLDYIKFNYTNLDKISVFDIANPNILKKECEYVTTTPTVIIVSFGLDVVKESSAKDSIDQFMKPYKKLMFRNLPKFTRSATYRVDVPWLYLEGWLDGLKEQFGNDFQIDPDFQRAHVWNELQQIRYVEYVLKEGMGSKDILWNCPGWQHGEREGPMVLVDGKQRLEAVRKFLRNELSVFGHKLNEFHDKPREIFCRFSMNVNDLETKAEVLQWYLDINDGGIAHTPKEIERVRKMLEKEIDQ